MTEPVPPTISVPQPIDTTFAQVISETKAAYVSGGTEAKSILQQGAATIDMAGWPGWPSGLDVSTTNQADPIIETYVAGARGVTATSENEPFVSAWLPLMEWLNTTIRSALLGHAVELDGDAYATASLTPTAVLEGVAHMDDDTFVPPDSVGVVAILGQLAGPRIATGSLTPEPLRPMSQVTWTTELLTEFEADGRSHCRCLADQLVIFPQFGQLHAGPTADDVQTLASHRQLLVYRAKVQLPGR